jgi:hypothetical protein
MPRSARVLPLLLTAITAMPGLAQDKVTSKTTPLAQQKADLATDHIRSGDFRWTVGPSLLGPAERPADPCHSIKDLVWHDGLLWGNYYSSHEGKSSIYVAKVQLSQKNDAKDPLGSWRKRVKISPVSPKDQHSVHSYFNTCPESPDGRWVLYYASASQTGYDGEIRVLERATGKEKVLARNVVVEDAHRVACQQWICGGKQIVFHNRLETGAWVVMAVDLETGRERILAKDRQVGFGQPHGVLVPVCGLHWNPGMHRDLELLNVESGEIIKSPVTADAVKKAYPEWISRQFGDGPVSIYIPILSPDLHKVFFKMATPGRGDFRSRQASKREGLLCYDLRHSRFLFQHDKWGHPAWHPDSRHIINVPGVVIDTVTGKSRPIPSYPKLPGSHPSFSPDGKLFASDTLAAPFGGPIGTWAAGVGDVTTGEFVTVHTFDNSKGARSWRVSHPHPVFSADGARLYFNVSADGWSRLFVAEAAR